MNLLFIYDTSICNPDGDPSEAMIYFYPLQELESERCTLYYQLVGIAQFLEATFSSPSVIALDNSRFVTCRLKNYLFVLGGNKHENVQLLKTQLRLIYKTFAFYYCSIAQVLHLTHNDKDLFRRKISSILSEGLCLVVRFRTRINLSSHSLPVIVFPQDDNVKPAALLNMCQAEYEVLAGAVFFNYKLLYTQVLPDVTSALSVLAAHNVSGIDVSVKYKLPPGVKLKYVYLTQKEMTYLQKRRCKQYTKGRSKRVSSLWSNSGSEGDVESDCRNREFDCDLMPGDSLQTFSLLNHYQKGLFRRHCSMHLPCSSHRIQIPFCNLKNGIRQTKKESCDLEFQCLLCKNEHKWVNLSKSQFFSALKRWNSETDVMCFSSQQCIMSEFLTPRHSRKRYSKSGDKHRKQLFQKSSKPSSSSSQDTDSIEKPNSQRRDSNRWTDFYYSPFCKFVRSEDISAYSPISADDEMHQECVLYVQRCGDCLLMLLLSDVPSMNTLHYLWHCGFSYLPSIAYTVRRRSNRKPSLSEDRSDFSIYTHKYQSKVLLGKLSTREDTYFDNLKSSIHEDFYADPFLHSITIMDSKRSVCAYNTKEKQIFYEQPSTVHRKTNWFSQLWERASRRTEKYLHITLPKF